MLVKIVALLEAGAGDARVKIGALGLLGVLAKEEWVGRELRGMSGEFESSRRVALGKRWKLNSSRFFLFFRTEPEPDGSSFFKHLGNLARNRDVGVQVAAVEVFVSSLVSSFPSKSSPSDLLSSSIQTGNHLQVYPIPHHNFG